MDRRRRMLISAVIVLAVVGIVGCGNAVKDSEPPMDTDNITNDPITNDILSETEEREKEKPVQEENFKTAVDSRPAWSAFVYWYYSDEREVLREGEPGDICKDVPLDDCLEGLRSGEVDMVMIACDSELLGTLSEYEAVPVFKDAVIFLRSNSTNNAGFDLSSERIKQAFTEEGTFYWDEEQTDPIIPSLGYGAQIENELWPQISALFGFSAASQNVMTSDGFDNPVQAIHAAGIPGSGLWPYYFCELWGDMGLNGEPISVDGVAPAKQTVDDGTYPYTLNYYAVFSKQSEYYDRILTFVDEIKEVTKGRIYSLFA